MRSDACKSKKRKKGKGGRVNEKLGVRTVRVLNQQVGSLMCVFRKCGRLPSLAQRHSRSLQTSRTSHTATILFQPGEGGAPLSQRSNHVTGPLSRRDRGAGISEILSISKNNPYEPLLLRIAASPVECTVLATCSVFESAYHLVECLPFPDTQPTAFLCFSLACRQFFFLLSIIVRIEAECWTHSKS